MHDGLLNEIEALLRAHGDQVESWRAALKRSDDEVTLREVVNVLVHTDSVQRQAILLLAEEIDRLQAAQTTIASAWQSAFGVAP